jgi:hypothetical protein
MRWLYAIAVFGGMGAVGCLMTWFGVTHPRFQFEYQREKWANAPPDRVRKLKRGLLIGLGLAELVLIAAGLTIAAGQR